MNNRRKWLGAVALAAVVRPAAAQSPNFPSKAISLVGPFPAGASTDVISRIYAAKLSPLMGAPVVGRLTLGILLGVLVIVSAWLLTWIYVRWANRHYDAAIRRLRGRRP